jgi:hypothetical protein
MAAYTGALTRSAHYSFRPPVPGINPDHEHPHAEPDPFSPVPDSAGQGIGGTVWQPGDLPVHTDMVVAARPHTTPLQPPVPSNVHQAQANLAATSRMLANHSRVEYRPDTVPVYRHATQGRTLDYVPGRMPLEAGITVPDNASYLVAGKNAFDYTNPANEVYAGDGANVGRYRLGVAIEDFGRYEYHTKQGQDAVLRAYVGLEPTFPADKPRVPNSAPQTPNSAGTTTWLQSQWQVPSLFAVPSETAGTDFLSANVPAADGGGFDDGGRL